MVAHQTTKSFINTILLLKVEFMQGIDGYSNAPVCMGDFQMCGSCCHVHNTNICFFVVHSSFVCHEQSITVFMKKLPLLQLNIPQFVNSLKLCFLNCYIQNRFTTYLQLGHVHNDLFSSVLVFSRCT